MTSRALMLLALAPLAWAQPRLENRFLNVQLRSDGTLRVTDKRAGREWIQRAGREVTVRNTRKPMALDLRDTANELDLHASFTLAADKPEIELTLEASGPVRRPVAFPHAFTTGPGATLAIPLNEGILYPAGDETIRPMQLIAYGGHGMSMPWWGVFDDRTGAGVMAIIRTPDDARIDIARHFGAVLSVRPLWDSSRQEFRYTRKLLYCFFDRGGYVAQAKRYREYARAAGLFRTLEEKRRVNPNVDRLIGAANIWNRDMDKAALCREMKAMGMERILWSSGGSPEQLAEINKLGYLSSRYDIFQDVWPPDAPAGLRKEGWPDDLVWLPNGDWMKGWASHRTNPDGTRTIYQGGVISSPRQLARARERIPPELKTHPYLCRFIDTTTASPFREDYNPAHPLTRSDDRKYKMQLLEYCSKDLNLVVGTETGIDPSVPYVHYYEGMLSLGPYRLPDAGRDMLKYKPPTPEFLKFQVGHFYRAPLWELVYHDCVVSQWYWGDYNNKAPEVWDRRDLFNILYGTPPMYMFDRAGWEKDKARFLESYKKICPVARRLGYDEMLSHEFVSPDHAVQRTVWKSGAKITVDFNSGKWSVQ